MKQLHSIIKKMWGNNGRILAEYKFLKKFKNGDYNNYLEIEGLEHLEKIK